MTPEEFRKKLAADREARNTPTPTRTPAGPRPLSHLAGYLMVLLEDLKAQGAATIKLRPPMNTLVKNGLADKLEYVDVRDLLRDDLGLIEIIGYPTQSQMPSVLPVIEDGKVVRKAGYRVKPTVLDGDSVEFQLGGPFVPLPAPTTTPAVSTTTATPAKPPIIDDIETDPGYLALMEQLKPDPDLASTNTTPPEWKVDDYVPLRGS